jgi:hypothetical protein
MEGAVLGVSLQMTGDNVTPQIGSLSKSLMENRTAFRELAMGVGFLGMSMSSMGVMFKTTNNELGKSVGNTLLLAGAMMTGISSAVHMVAAIAKVTHALQLMTTAEIMAKAFSPFGLITIGLGALATVGTVAGVNAMNRNEAKSVNIVNHIQGNVVTSKELANEMRQQIILTGQRNRTAGIP